MLNRCMKGGQMSENEHISIKQEKFYNQLQPKKTQAKQLLKPLTINFEIHCIFSQYDPRGMENFTCPLSL